jgi:hypothetical protein
MSKSLSTTYAVNRKVEVRPGYPVLITKIEGIKFSYFFFFFFLVDWD